MNMFWMVEVLVATLCAIAASFAAAVTADAVSRRSHARVSDRADTAASPSPTGVLTARTARRERDWHRVAIQAWAICHRLRDRGRVRRAADHRGISPRPRPPSIYARQMAKKVPADEPRAQLRRGGVVLCNATASTPERLVRS